MGQSRFLGAPLSRERGAACFNVSLRTPEAAVERRLADRVALAGAGLSSRAARFADPVLALLVDEDIATGLRRELRPAA